MTFPNCAPLCGEYRGEQLDIIKFGHFCVIDEHGHIVLSGGDPEATVFYRSAAKPLQALPTLMRRLPEKYGLTMRETAILAASHKGESCHVEVLESIMEKTGLSEDDMIMLPTAPEKNATYDGVKRKIYHNCSGKHLSLLLLQRELTGKTDGYHLLDSPAQTEIRQTVAALSGCSPDELGIAIDGCGVPVFAAKVRQMAHAFLRMACPDLLGDPAMTESIRHLQACMNAHPEMIRGSDSECLFMNSDPNIIAKSGANGVYCFGLKKERLGVSLKMIDGTPAWLPFAVRGILTRLGYENRELLDQLHSLMPDCVKNDCGKTVGKRECFF